jgi:hypothetical protein
LRQEAEREPYEDRRRHLLDLAAQYQRAAENAGAASGRNRQASVLIGAV